MVKGDIRAPLGAHLNEKNFRRFEQLIARLVDTYPLKFEVKPERLAPATFAVQFRNAVNAALTGRYPTQIDLTELRKVWNTVIARVEGDKFVAGTKSVLSAETMQSAKDSDIATRLLYDLVNPTVEQLEHIQATYLQRLSEKPSRFSGVMPEWTPHPVVSLFQQPDGTWLMA